ncbi:FCD domain-containing protein [Kineococcus sp. T13]|nr:GntR family transcriptional regulator [Kineococcus vitellinus]NAZ75946.1 FCD domain-containing protein [Kineococcus vitellinus]
MERLRRRIVGLELAPGAPLSENELAGELGVSRTPVRESLIVLVEEGLVSVVPQVGTFVSPVRLGDIATAQFIREALELASLGEAVERADDSDVAELRELLAEQRRAAARDDQDAFMALDDAFHVRLMAVSAHAAAWRAVGRAKAHLDRARRMSLPLPDQLGVLIDQHEAVVDAVAARDATAAAAALRTHLRKVFDDIAVIREQHPGFFTADEG